MRPDLYDLGISLIHNNGIGAGAADPSQSALREADGENGVVDTHPAGLASGSGSMTTSWGLDVQAGDRVTEALSIAYGADTDDRSESSLEAAIHL